MKKRTIIFVILFIVIAVVVTAILYININLNKVTTKIIPESDEELGITKIEDNDNVEEKNQEKATLNIALLGIDKREDDQGRSDTIMIVSIDYEHNTIKLSSIMRDTYVAIDGEGMTKINHAYAYGGPLLSIKTINQNFNLDIRDYVLVNLDGLKEIIDELGGVDITIKDYEIPSMSECGINLPGDYHLNGTQALAYCRIRYQGNGDFERTDRQREVLEKLFNQIKTMDIVQMTSLLNRILPYIETSYTKFEIIELMKSVLNTNATTFDQKRFPVDGYCHDEIIDGVYYLVIDLEENIKQLRDFIYN